MVLWGGGVLVIKGSQNQAQEVRPEGQEASYDGQIIL